MNFQTLFRLAPMTTMLLVIIVVIFALQALTGISLSEPTTKDLVRWGANALPLTLGDEPWRLLSSAFIHIGLMHLLFNGFALYFFGLVAEIRFGSLAYLALFLLSALGSSLLNNTVTWWQILHDNGAPSVSAGASGGVMGIGAALLITAMLRSYPHAPALNIKSLAIIMGINLAYGFAVPGIDNAGHIGGALTGMLLGLCWGLLDKYVASAQARRIGILASIIVLVIGFAAWWWYLHQQLLVALALS